MNLVSGSAMISALEMETTQTSSSRGHNKSTHDLTPRHMIQHNYHDFANAVPTEAVEQPKARGGVTTPFPIRLHMMLDKIEEDGFAHVVSWQPHGRCFIVHKQKQFLEHVMPTYFNQSKFASFQRQLNLYGFSRLTFGEDRGGYYHELFLRGKSFLCHQIQRKKVKGTGVRPASNPKSEPNFYKMPSVEEKSASLVNIEIPNPVISSTVSVEEDEESNMISHSDYDDLFDDEVKTFAGKSFHYLDNLPKLFTSTSAIDIDACTPAIVRSSGREQEHVSNGLDPEFDALISILGLTPDLLEDETDSIKNDTEFGFLLERTIA
eukprot:scaffold877_cov57-Attheya_sp.AAC.7